MLRTLALLAPIALIVTGCSAFTQTATYRVTGNADTAQVSYLDNATQQSGTQQLPFEVDVEGAIGVPGQFMLIVNGEGPVGCSITIDGEVVASQRSDLGFVSCSG